MNCDSLPFLTNVLVCHFSGNSLYQGLMVSHRDVIAEVSFFSLFWIATLVRERLLPNGSLWLANSLAGHFMPWIRILCVSTGGLFILLSPFVRRTFELVYFSDEVWRDIARRGKAAHSYVQLTKRISVTRRYFEALSIWLLFNEFALVFATHNLAYQTSFIEELVWWHALLFCMILAIGTLNDDDCAQMMKHLNDIDIEESDDSEIRNRIFS